MKRSRTETHKIANSKALHALVFAIAMISFTLNGWNAQAANVISTDYRLATADDKFADVSEFMVIFKVRPRRRLRAKSVELAIGTISTSRESKPFVSIGPAWRLPIDSRSLLVDLWFSPTLLGRPSFSGRDMTGNIISHLWPPSAQPLARATTQRCLRGTSTRRTATSIAPVPV